MAKDTKEIVFSEEVLKKLQAIPRKLDYATWILLGADETGVVQDFEEVIITREQCYTATMDSTEFSKALISLYKRGIASIIGIYIVDGTRPNRRGTNVHAKTVFEWFHNHSYAFHLPQLCEEGMIYVKEGLQDRTAATAGIMSAYGSLENLAMRVLKKAPPAVVKEPIDTLEKAELAMAIAEITARASY